ncbi:MAG TPA: DUF3617 domain-containing protein [Terriglobales bacterium]|nr:DUF3617 domain-containing protein [Terriglobales bacterium]
MRTIPVVAVLLLSSMSVWGQKLPLDVRLGLWETTAQTNIGGQLPLTPEQTGNLTPEQRARIEQAMKASSGKPITSKSCLTKEKLDKGFAFNERKECTHNLLTSNSHNLEVQMTCNEKEGQKVNVLVKAQALSSTNVKGTTHITMEGGGHTMTSDGTFTSKWISSDCGSVK